MRRLRDDNRGLSTGVVLIIAAIVVGGLMFTLLNPAAGLIIDAAGSQASSTEAQEVIDLRKQIWGAVLYAVLGVVALFAISRAVFESRRPG